MHKDTRARGRVRELVRDPVSWTEGIQVVKTVVAAVVAWVLASEVFALPQPFLAPWAALLVVHATVYRSFWRGAKQITATVVGVVLAWATGNTLGVDATALTVMLLAALMVGNIRWMREESATAAATALIVLTTGTSDQDHVLIARLLDTSIGVLVGLVVNAVVWPPLRDHAAARAIASVHREIGDLLRDMAACMRAGGGEDEVQEWVRRSQHIDGHVDEAWALVRQARESGRLNPRRDSRAVREPGAFGEMLDRIEQALAEIRSMARTVGHSIVDVHEWDEEFRDRWVALLDEVGGAVQGRDSERLSELRGSLSALASDYSTAALPGLYWAEYGGLLLNLRNIATSMDRVVPGGVQGARSEPSGVAPGGG